MAAPTFRDYVRHWPISLALVWMWLLARLPHRLQRGIAKGLGALLYRLIKRRRDIGEQNLAACLPDQDTNALNRANFYHTGLTLVEMSIGWMGRLPLHAQDCEIQGLEHLQNHPKDQGLILLTGHFLALEMCCGFVSMHHPLCPVYRPHKNPLLNHYMEKVWSAHTHDIVPRGNLKKMVRLLKSGETLWYAPDQDFGTKQSVFADFFGQPTATLTATTKLIKLTGAKVLGMSMVRLEKGWRVTIEPIEGLTGEQEQQDANAYNRWLEQAIRRQPELYLWQHRRFKTRPEGIPSIYK